MGNDTPHTTRKPKSRSPLTGFVGSDPQVKTVGEQKVASFSIAVSRKNRAGEKQTVWVRVNAWNRLAEVAEQFLKRGSLVQISADWLRPSAWVDQSGTPQSSLDVDASRLVLLDRAPDGDAKDQPEQIPF